MAAIAALAARDARRPASCWSSGLPIYPAYVRDAETLARPRRCARRVLRMQSTPTASRATDDWAPGSAMLPPAPLVLARSADAGVAAIVEPILAAAR